MHAQQCLDFSMQKPLKDLAKGVNVVLQVLPVKILRTGSKDVGSEILKSILEAAVLLDVCHHHTRLFDQSFSVREGRLLLNAVVTIQSLVEALAIAQEVDCILRACLDASTMVVDGIQGVYGFIMHLSHLPRIMDSWTPFSDLRMTESSSLSNETEWPVSAAS